MHGKPYGPHTTCKSINTTTSNAFLDFFWYVKIAKEVSSQMSMGWRMWLPLERSSQVPPLVGHDRQANWAPSNMQINQYNYFQCFPRLFMMHKEWWRSITPNEHGLKDMATIRRDYPSPPTCGACMPRQLAPIQHANVSIQLLQCIPRLFMMWKECKRSITPNEHGFEGCGSH